MTQRGAAGEVIPLLEQLAEELPENKGAVTAALAGNYVETGRVAEAHHLLRTFAATGFAHPPNPGDWLFTMTRYALVAVASRDAEIAGALFNRLVPFADQIPTTAISAYDPVSHVLGQLATVLDRFDDADAYFSHAAAFNDRAGAKFFAANNDLAWARMLLQRDAPSDIERARDLLTAAHTVAAAHGYSGIERDVAEALKHLDWN
jgi:tetratricopeptide (TPR) repeat protein